MAWSSKRRRQARRWAADRLQAERRRGWLARHACTDRLLGSYSLSPARVSSQALVAQRQLARWRFVNAISGSSQPPPSAAARPPGSALARRDVTGKLDYGANRGTLGTLR